MRITRACSIVVTIALTAVVAPWTTAGPAAAAPVQALLVGDSVMNGMAQGYAAQARAELAARHSYILDTAGCRRLITTSCSIGGKPAPTNAITVIRSRAGQYHGSLVIAVGYNDPPTGSVGVSTAVDTIVAAARQSGISDVVWLTYREAGPAGNVARFRASNAVLRAKAAEIPELRLADWNAASAGLPSSWFSGDGIHLGGQAALAMARLVADALDRAPVGRCGTAPGGDAPSDGPVASDGAGAGGLHLLPAPVRLLDTRTWPAPVGAGRVVAVPAASAAGVPGATAAVVSVVRVDACAAGYVTAFPCGGAPPNASIVNGPQRSTVANAAIVALGDGGGVCVFTSAASDLIVDLLGVVGPDGYDTAPVSPRRLVDTRSGAPQALDVPKARVGQQGLTVDVAPIVGAGALPAALAVNLTAVGPGGDGYLSLLPGACTGATPSTSTLNVRSGHDAAAAGTVRLVDGRFCVYSHVDTDVVIDLHATYGDHGDRSAADDPAGGNPAGAVEGGGDAAGASITPVAPQRRFDSRAGSRLAAGEQRVLPGLVTDGHAGAIVNVTVVDPAAAGYVSVYPCGPQPEVSNVNVAAGATTANMAVLLAGAGGEVCVFSSVATDVLIDVEAWIG